jgi:hypothetical protein
MPVSRKRKNRKSASRPKQPAKRPLTVPGGAPAELPEVFSGLLEHRQRLDVRRAEVAAELAAPLVADLIEDAPGRTDDDLEDELCRRLGAELAATDGRPLEELVNPEQLGEAILDAAAEAVRRAERGTAARRASWHVLAVLARALPHPLREQADNLIIELSGPGEWSLPDRTPTGPVLWARDAYGSRFAIAAQFATDRWYLWDVDTCGFKTFTVHSGVYPTAEAALAEWRTGVGDLAAGPAVLTPADDAELVAELLFNADGIVRSGGEHEEHYAEYFRGRRLAQAAIETVPEATAPARPPLGEEQAAEEFAAWLRGHRTPPDDIEELATELASSWATDTPASLYATCSPHRVALTVMQMRDYYKPDFVAELIALLPEWVSWLAEREDEPAELVERCRPYTSGAPHPGIVMHGKEPDYFARTIE